MQQELIEMLEEIIQYVEVWHPEDGEALDRAEALIKKAKNNAPAVPQGEPDFWGSGDGCWVRATDKLARPDASRFNIPLYAAPSQEPVTLTDEEIDRVVLEAVGFEGYGCQAMNKADMRGVSRAIIAALRAKENKL